MSSPTKKINGQNFTAVETVKKKMMEKKKLDLFFEKKKKNRQWKKKRKFFPYNSSRFPFFKSEPQQKEKQTE